MGRVTAINIVTGTGARPLGALLGGFVGEFSSDSVGLLVVVLGFTVQAIIISFSAVRHVQSAEQEAQKLDL
jgi:ketol-acid reductoisomerase